MAEILLAIGLWGLTTFTIATYTWREAGEPKGEGACILGYGALLSALISCLGWGIYLMVQG
jgi:hypothetical protein